MADRRKQPYLPLYVQDFLTDEKLRECSATSIGVYIFIMCIMHKSEHYGTILLKQKDKQSDNQVLNFALKLAKHLPFSSELVYDALKELLLEEIVKIELDSLIQKRMVKDGEISAKRSAAGLKGGRNSLGSVKTGFRKPEFAQAKNKAKGEDFAQAKPQANSDIEIDIENDNDIIEIGEFEGKENFKKLDEAQLIRRGAIFTPPSREEFMSYAYSKMKSDEEWDSIKRSVELKYESWVAADWVTGGKKPRKIKKWKQTLLNTLPHLKKEEVKNSIAGETAMEALRRKHGI